MEAAKHNVGAIGRGNVVFLPMLSTTSDSDKPHHSKPSSSTFCCVECDAKFSSEDERNRHTCQSQTGKYNEGGEEQFKCGECGKVFCYEAELAIHATAHSGSAECKLLKCSSVFEMFFARDSHSSCDVHIKKEPNSEELNPFAAVPCDTNATPTVRGEDLYGSSKIVLAENKLKTQLYDQSHHMSGRQCKCFKCGGSVNASMSLPDCDIKNTTSSEEAFEKCNAATVMVTTPANAGTVDNVTNKSVKLKEHGKVINPSTNKSMKFEECGKTFSLSRHIGGTHYRCNKCSLLFMTFSYWAKHSCSEDTVLVVKAEKHDPSLAMQPATDIINNTASRKVDNDPVDTCGATVSQPVALNSCSCLPSSSTDLRECSKYSNPPQINRVKNYPISASGGIVGGEFKCDKGGCHFMATSEQNLHEPLCRRNATKSSHSEENASFAMSSDRPSNFNIVAGDKINTNVGVSERSQENEINTHICSSSQAISRERRSSKCTYSKDTSNTIHIGENAVNITCTEKINTNSKLVPVLSQDTEINMHTSASELSHDIGLRFFDCRECNSSFTTFKQLSLHFCLKNSVTSNESTELECRVKRSQPIDSDHNYCAGHINCNRCCSFSPTFSHSNEQAYSNTTVEPNPTNKEAGIARLGMKANEHVEKSVDGNGLEKLKQSDPKIKNPALVSILRDKPKSAPACVRELGSVERNLGNYSVYAHKKQFKESNCSGHSAVIPKKCSDTYTSEALSCDHLYSRSNDEVSAAHENVSAEQFKSIIPVIKLNLLLNKSKNESITSTAVKEDVNGQMFQQNHKHGCSAFDILNKPIDCSAQQDSSSQLNTNVELCKPNTVGTEPVPCNKTCLPGAGSVCRSTTTKKNNSDLLLTRPLELSDTALIRAIKTDKIICNASTAMVKQAGTSALLSASDRLDTNPVFACPKLATDLGGKLDKMKNEEVTMREDPPATPLTSVLMSNTAINANDNSNVAINKSSNRLQASLAFAKKLKIDKRRNASMSKNNKLSTSTVLDSTWPVDPCSIPAKGIGHPESIGTKHKLNTLFSKCIICHTCFPTLSAWNSHYCLKAAKKMPTPKSLVGKARLRATARKHVGKAVGKVRLRMTARKHTGKAVYSKPGNEHSIFGAVQEKLNKNAAHQSHENVCNGRRVLNKQLGQHALPMPALKEARVVLKRLKTYNCTKCEAVFFCFAKLSDHMHRQHDDNSSVSITSFTSSTTTKKEMCVETSICPTKSQTQSSVRNISGNQFKCIICYTYFPTLSLWNSHYCLKAASEIPPRKSVVGKGRLRVTARKHIGKAVCSKPGDEDSSFGVVQEKLNTNAVQQSHENVCKDRKALNEQLDQRVCRSTLNEAWLGPLAEKAHLKTAVKLINARKISDEPIAYAETGFSSLGTIFGIDSTVNSGSNLPFIRPNELRDYGAANEINAGQHTYTRPTSMDKNLYTCLTASNDVSFSSSAKQTVFDMGVESGKPEEASNELVVGKEGLTETCFSSSEIKCYAAETPTGCNALLSRSIQLLMVRKDEQAGNSAQSTTSNNLGWKPNKPHVCEMLVSMEDNNDDTVRTEAVAIKEEQVEMEYVQLDKLSSEAVAMKQKFATHHVKCEKVISSAVNHALSGPKKELLADVAVTRQLETNRCPSASVQMNGKLDGVLCPASTASSQEFVDPIIIVTNEDEFPDMSTWKNAKADTLLTRSHEILGDSEGVEKGLCMLTYLGTCANNNSYKNLKLQDGVACSSTNLHIAGLGAQNDSSSQVKRVDFLPNSGNTFVTYVKLGRLVNNRDNVSPESIARSQEFNNPSIVSDGDDDELPNVMSTMKNVKADTLPSRSHEILGVNETAKKRRMCARMYSDTAPSNNNCKKVKLEEGSTCTSTNLHVVGNDDGLNDANLQFKKVDLFLNSGNTVMANSNIQNLRRRRNKSGITPHDWQQESLVKNEVNAGEHQIDSDIFTIVSSNVNKDLLPRKTGADFNGWTSTSNEVNVANHRLEFQIRTCTRDSCTVGKCDCNLKRKPISHSVPILKEAFNFLSVKPKKKKLAATKRNGCPLKYQVPSLNVHKANVLPPSVPLLKDARVVLKKLDTFCCARCETLIPCLAECRSLTLRQHTKNQYICSACMTIERK